MVKRVHAGDPSAWGDIYDLHAKDLYRRILMPRLADTHAAEDALSDTFRTAIEKFAQFEPKREGSLFSWLCRIAHNKAMDMHRARSISGRKIEDLSRLLAPLSSTMPGAEDLLILKDESDLITKSLGECLMRLTPRYREALQLRFLTGLSRAECAAHFAIKEGTFDVLLLRALRALRKLWAEVAP